VGVRPGFRRSLPRVHRIKTPSRSSHTVDSPAGSRDGIYSIPRDRRTSPKRCYRSSRSQVKGLLFNLLRRSKEGRRVEAHSKPEASQQIHRLQKVHDGDGEIRSPIPLPRGLGGQHGPEGCLPSRSHPAGPPSVPPFCLPSKGLSIQGVALRPSLGPPGVHHGSKSHSQGVTHQGYHVCSLPGRLSDHSQVQAGSSGSGSDFHSLSPTGRVHSQPQEVLSDTFSGPSFSRGQASHRFRLSPSSVGKSPTRESVRKNLLSSFCASGSRMSSTSRSHGKLSLGSSSGPSPNAAIPDLFSGPVEFNPVSTRPSHIHTPVVGPVLRDLVGLGMAHSRGSVSGSHSNLTDNDRCVQERLGGPFRVLSNSGEMENTPVVSTHQLSGNASRVLHSSKIRLLSQGSSGFGVHGQYLSPTVHKQTRRDQVGISVCSNSQSSPVVCRERHLSHGSTCPRYPKHSCRPAVQTVLSFNRVVPKAKSGRFPFSRLGRTFHGLVRYRRKQTLSGLLRMAQRRKCSSFRRPVPRLAWSVRLRLPALSDSPKGHSKGSKGSGRTNPDRPLVAHTGLVRTSASSAHREPHLPSPIAGPSHAEEGQSLAPQSRGLVPGSLAVKCRFLQAKGLSRKVAKTIIASRSEATYKKYNSAWKLYSAWARKKGLDPPRTNVSQVLDYLQFCAEKQGLSHSTVRSRLYAIALYHEDLPLDKLSLHPLATRFIKGMTRIFPSVKSRHPKWNLQLVLQALRGPPFEPMVAANSDGINMLTFKTVFLLAVVTAKRVGELQALSSDKRYLTIDGPGITLRLNPAFIPKVNSQQNREKEVFFTPFCPQQPNSRCTLFTLCLRRAVRKYLLATKPFRKTDQLLVCFSGPNRGHAATKTTISRWVRRCIQEAYIACKQPLPEGIKAHDVRGMATSWAQFNSASLADICDTASWSQGSTFATHYQLNLAGNRPSARFGNAVLQTVLDGRPR